MPESMYQPTTSEISARRKALAPEIHEAFERFSGAVFAEGALPEKTKQLIAVAVAHVTQCPYCISSIQPNLLLCSLWCCGSPLLSSTGAIVERRRRTRKPSARGPRVKRSERPSHPRRHRHIHGPIKGTRLLDCISRVHRLRCLQKTERQYAPGPVLPRQRRGSSPRSRTGEVIDGEDQTSRLSRAESVDRELCATRPGPA